MVDINNRHFALLSMTWMLCIVVDNLKCMSVLTDADVAKGWEVRHWHEEISKIICVFLLRI